MNSIQKLTFILQIVLAALVVIMIVVGLVIFWYKKIRKPSANVEGDVDYSGLERRDSLDYMKFDAIERNMIIRKDCTEFHAAIRCQGFDFYTAQGSERKMAHDGFLSFINSWTDDITFRQFTKKVDMDDTLKSYQDAYDRVEQELFNVSQDFDSLQAQFVQAKNTCLMAEEEMEPELEQSYLDQLIFLNNRMENLDWQRHHLGDNISYVNEVSSMTAPERVETYVFKWVYKPLLGKELTDEQIIEKASRELSRIADSHIHALSNAGVNAYRVKTDELKQMVRRHWHPFTANVYKSADVENSNFYQTVSTSPAMIDADYEVAAEMGILNDVYVAQDKLEATGKNAESMTMDDLLAFGSGKTEENENRLTSSDIEGMQQVITNRFKEREEQRLKQEEEEAKNAARAHERRASEGLSTTSTKSDDNSERRFVSNKIDFGSLDSFHLDDQ